MKRDLERFGEKLTPEEERRIWSRMRDALHERGRGEGRPHLAWLGRLSLAAGMAVLAFAIWRAGQGPQGPGEWVPSPTELPPAAVVMEGQDTEGAKRTDVADEVPAEEVLDQTKSAAEPSVGARDRSLSAEKTATEERALIAEKAAEGTQHRKAAPAEKSVTAMAELHEETESQQETEPKAAVRRAGGPTVQPPADREAQAPRDVDESTEGLAELEEPQKPSPQYAAEGARVTAPTDTLGKMTIQILPGSGPGEIRGRIFNEATGDPVAYAQVVVLGTRKGAMVREDGTFVIQNIPDGTYDLKIMMMRYKQAVIPDITVRQNEVVDLAVSLQESPYDIGLGEVVVQGRRTKLVKKRSEGARGADEFAWTPREPQEKSEAAGERPQFHLYERGGRSEDVEHKINLKAGTPPEKRYPSLTGGDVPVNDELADDMFFQHYGVNPFIEAEEDALSTFGLDVDTGSYTIVRKYIQDGALPPPEAVRVEEFVNYFRKDYEPPKNADFRIQIDGMPSPFANVQDGGYWLFRVGIRGRVIEEKDRLPVQLILVIDSSGSMDMQNRLELVKGTMDVLLDELRTKDEVGVVAYERIARVVLPLTPVSEKETIRNAIHSLSASGSTNAEAGLKLAYEMAEDSRRAEWLQRIILCSDGVANVGRTGWESILREVRDGSDRTPITTVGFGMGNYNDVLMEQLADAGDGQYAYVDNLSEAIRVFRENISGTLLIISRNTKAQIEFDPERVAKYRLLGYENRDIRDEDFRNNKIDAGEIGAGHEVTALYEVKLRDELKDGPLATVRIRYEKPEGGEFVELEETIRSGDLYGSVDKAPGGLILDAAVAEFAEILRKSYWAKESSHAAVLDLLQKLPDSLAQSADVIELRELVERASALGE